MTVRDHWRKSSKSAQEANCVEVAFSNAVGAVRDSKHPLAEIGVDVAELVSAVKSGRISRI